jgi:hypothetical protein
MAAFFRAFRAFAMMYPMLGASVLAGSLADIEHVVLFMQGWYTFRSTLHTD